MSMYSTNNRNTTKSTYNSASAPVAVATVLPTSQQDAASPLLPPITPYAQTDMTPFSEQTIRRLQSQGFTQSLARSLEEVKKEFALRIWIVDNSGSMNEPDGHRMIESGKTIRMVDCTRWEEIRSSVEYHMRLASLIKAPTRFRLLNPARGPNGMLHELTIALGDNTSGIDNDFEAEDVIQQLRRVRPEGSTPLTRHIREIRQQIIDMAPALRQNGQRVAVVIATDGLPTDERGQGGDYEQRTFVEALRLLEGLPVWIVIRLCTDEDDVVAFYNDIDAVLELSVDVLDDFTAEAHEIHEFNPWVNYGLPLHRVREMGSPNRLLDLIDERPFTKSEIYDFCSMLFGNFDGIPDPTTDWKGFISHLGRLVENESDQWNAIRRRPKPWVSMKKLGRRKGILC